MTAPTLYNLTVETAKRAFTDANADALMDRFAELSPAVGMSDHGFLEAIVTVPAKSLRQAVSIVLGMCDAEPVSVTALRTDEFDRRVGIRPDVEAVTITVQEAAERLGLTEQAVRLRLKAGTLAGEKRGKSWRVLASSVA